MSDDCNSPIGYRRLDKLPFVHAKDDFPAYVYDIIEPGRSKVDATILAVAAARNLPGLISYF